MDGGNRLGEDGQSNEAALKDGLWVDDTCDFILSLKLLFALPLRRSVQTEEKRDTLTSLLTGLPQESHTLDWHPWEGLR